MRKLSKRTLASRANGKLSRGPVTPAGLLRASANSTRHGMLSENLVLDDESKDLFALLHQQFIDRFNPTDGMEICLVEDLASTVWRQRRLVAIETHLFKEAAAKRPEPTYLGRIGGAFSDLCRTPEMHLLDRYESRLHRMFQRTLKNLELLRQIEHTDPSTGELTQLPVEVTGIPDTDCGAPAPGAVFTPGEHLPDATEIRELPNEPSGEQPPVESTAHPATSITDPMPENAEGLNTKGGADFSLLPTELEVPSQHSPEVPQQEAPPAPPAPTTEIHELPNEPTSAHPKEKSPLYLERLDPTPNPIRPPAGLPSRNRLIPMPATPNSNLIPEPAISEESPDRLRPIRDVPLLNGNGSCVGRRASHG